MTNLMTVKCNKVLANVDTAQPTSIINENNTRFTVLIT